jgi:hypothetical protein
VTKFQWNASTVAQLKMHCKQERVSLLVNKYLKGSKNA